MDIEQKRTEYNIYQSVQYYKIKRSNVECVQHQIFIIIVSLADSDKGKFNLCITRVQPH